MKIIDDLIQINPYSRPGTKLKSVKYLVVHYTGDGGCPGTRTRDYFNNLPGINAAAIEEGNKPVYVSSHYVCDLDGTFIRCIPENEIAYTQSGHNNEHNSIECAHPDDTGKFSEATYNAVVEFAADWFKRHPHSTVDKHFKRHYDFTKKMCPYYYVKHKDAWAQFKEDVKNKMEELEDDISERLDNSKIIVEHPAVSDDIPIIKPIPVRKPRTKAQTQKLNTMEKRLKDL